MYRGPDLGDLSCTLKNKGASRCHRRSFNIWRTFLFIKRLFVVKEGSSDYKKVRKRCFFKEPLTEWFFVEPKMVLLWHHLKNLLKHLYFKSVATLVLQGTGRPWYKVLQTIMKAEVDSKYECIREAIWAQWRSMPHTCTQFYSLDNKL